MEGCQKNILLLTPMYPAPDIPPVDTPVVHYFVREWVKRKINVHVVFLPVNFPRFYYWLAKPFKELIGTLTGGPIRTAPTVLNEYIIEDVPVLRIPMLKYFPHWKYSDRQFKAAYQIIVDYLNKKSFIPDIIISHFINPQVKLMYELKRLYNAKSCYIAHDSGCQLKTIFKKEMNEFIESWDVIGFRSNGIMRKMDWIFSIKQIPSFLCPSGIPEIYLPTEEQPKDFKTISKFIYVGTLIKRKFPTSVLEALILSYPDYKFSLTYLGDGGESTNIIRLKNRFNLKTQVDLKGKVSRDVVVEELSKVQVFVMISKNETFGLVYLEAMSRGCITIASKGEGFDGIIINGENGFLCTAGDIEELSSIINHIKSLPENRLIQISQNAINTAKHLTDKIAAQNYINNIIESINKQ